MIDEQEIIDIAVNSLENNKAIDVKVINIRDALYPFDNVIIGYGSSTRQVQAMYEYLMKDLKSKNLIKRNTRPDKSDRWATIDLGNIVVHIMTEESKLRYEMETFLSEELVISNQKNH